jgi:hypothetical protein
VPFLVTFHLCSSRGSRLAEHTERARKEIDLTELHLYLLVHIFPSLKRLIRVLSPALRLLVVFPSVDGCQHLEVTNESHEEPTYIRRVGTGLMPTLFFIPSSK